MRSTTFVTQLLLLIAPAIVSAQLQCTTARGQTCSTTRAAVPPGWPVVTRTRTTTLPPVTVTTTPTVIRTSTVPGVPLTATVSTTVIVTTTSTATPGTDTVLLTSTVFSTTALSTTTILTGTVTSTVATVLTQISTSVIPAPSGFINAYGSSGESNPAAQKRAINRRDDISARTENQRAQKRGMLDLLKTFWGSKTQFGTAGPVPNQKRYQVQDFQNPVAVNCVVTLAATCARANPTTITTTVTLAPSTTTTTIRATVTSTSIQIPPAVTTTLVAGTTTSTITQLTTIISSATSTLLTTTTSTTTSTTSLYAACATNNILGPQIASTPNVLISKVLFYDSNAKVVQTQEQSGYNCCVTCQTSSNCQFFQYGSSTGECFVVGGDQDWCPNNQQDYSFPAYYVYDAQSKVTDGKSVGNGGCGTLMSAGQDTDS